MYLETTIINAAAALLIHHEGGFRDSYREAAEDLSPIEQLRAQAAEVLKDAFDLWPQLRPRTGEQLRQQAEAVQFTACQGVSMQPLQQSGQQVPSSDAVVAHLLQANVLAQATGQPQKISFILMPNGDLQIL